MLNSQISPEINNESARVLSLCNPITCTFSSEKSLNPLSGKHSTFIQQALFSFKSELRTFIETVRQAGDRPNNKQASNSQSFLERTRKTRLEIYPAFAELGEV